LEKNEKKKLATINLYNISSAAASQAPAETNKLTVIYFDNEFYELLVNRIKAMLTQAQINDFFTFERLETAEEIEGRLEVGDYDMYLTTIDMGLQRDMTNLFATDKANINPSQYQNQKLVSLLQDYLHNDNQKSLNLSNEMYAKDIPFVMLGKAVTKLQMKESMAKKIFKNSQGS